MSPPVTGGYCYNWEAEAVAPEGYSELEGVTGTEPDWLVVNGDGSTGPGSIADN